MQPSTHDQQRGGRNFWPEDCGRSREVLKFLFRRIFTVREMEHEKRKAVDQCIEEATRQAAKTGRVPAPAIERFLRTGEQTWDGAGSGQFTPAQFKQDEAYRSAAKTALRILFGLLADLLPAETRLVPQVAPETIRQRIDPMVKGLLQAEWQANGRNYGNRALIGNQTVA
jgi:hypothetical protein